jgi:flagellar protein FliO/FliZ
MKSPKYIPLCFVIVSIILGTDCVLAASDEYLKYQEPQPSASSPFATFAYVISLVITFIAIIGLAYLTSKFLGQKLGKLNSSGNQRILLTFPLGPNKAVYIIEIAGKFLVLGVTDHNINLLQEITAPEEIEKLKQLNSSQPINTFEQVFEGHLSSLQNMSQKFPGVFKQNIAVREKEEKR